MADYVELNGVRTWWDERGLGESLVLLHGGLTDSRDFAGNLDRLSARFHVYLPERRGHGHTPDVDGPLTIEAMTADTIAFLEHVVGRPTRLVGYSAGAIVALHVAVQRPELVRRLVLISGAFSRAGMLVEPTADEPPPPALVDAYGEVSPDGAAHFPVVVAKVAAASMSMRALGNDELDNLQIPTLVVAADDDLVAVEHTVELHRHLPDAALAVIPYASHLLLHEHADQLTDLVGDFAAGVTTRRMMPIRRQPSSS